MYKQYWYSSALNKSMVFHLNNVVRSAETKLKERGIELKDGDVVVDIGCNDGTLFDQYTNKKLFKVGFDPSINIGEKARDKCHIFINDYFSVDDDFLERYELKHNEAKVITSIAMFYDLPDLNQERYLDNSINGFILNVPNK
jgi:NDP-4-keto-2,6-dideoxyhexose 3-C-methyltransferase